MTAEKRLMSVEEVCTYLSLPKPTIYAWVRTGKIPGVRRLGRALRFEKSEIDKWVESNGP